MLSTLSNLSKNAKNFAFKSPIYTLTLSGQRLKKLKIAPPSSWPGNRQVGLGLLRHLYNFGGQKLFLETPSWFPYEASDAWLYGMHSFGWISDLREVGSDAARRLARDLIENWMERNRSWQEVAWSGPVVGHRIYQLISQYEFYCGSARDEFKEKILDLIAKQTKHLARIIDISPELEIKHFEMLRGLIYGGLNIAQADKLMATSLSMLTQAIDTLLQTQEQSFLRHPIQHLELLCILIDIRTALKLAQINVPHPLNHIIDQMIAGVKFLRHMDGELCLFNGGHHVSDEWLQAALIQDLHRTKPIQSGSYLGYERLLAGKMLVLMDAGIPYGHRGLGSFEMSYGKQQIFVNCGASISGDEMWGALLKSTAAHTCLTLQDTNMSGQLGFENIRVDSQTYEHFLSLNLDHDGYQSRFKAGISRQLKMGLFGEVLEGVDEVVTSQDLSFTLRFHLHPKIQAFLIQDSQAVLLRLPQGEGFRFQADGHALELSESVYLGNGLTPQKTLQITLSALTVDTKSVHWTLKREIA